MFLKFIVIMNVIFECSQVCIQAVYYLIIRRISDLAEFQFGSIKVEEGFMKLVGLGEQRSKLLMMLMMTMTQAC